MEKLNGFEQARVLTGERTQLPAGGYIAKIKDCKEVVGTNYSYLAFSFDVAEGEHKEHFAGLYNASTDENKKWKGIFHAFIPREGTQYYEDNLVRFKTMTVDFEESNPGYHWDWNETALKGKVIGVVYGEKEFKPDGSDDILTITEARYFTSVQKIRDGKFKLPKLKKLKETAGFIVDEDDGDLPF